MATKECFCERTTKPVTPKKRSARVASAVQRVARRHCACSPHSGCLSDPESGGVQLSARVTFPAHPLSLPHLRTSSAGRHSVSRELRGHARRPPVNLNSATRRHAARPVARPERRALPSARSAPRREGASARAHGSGACEVRQARARCRVCARREARDPYIAGASSFGRAKTGAMWL